MEYICTLLSVTDLARSRSFYCDVLGMTVTADYGTNITLDGRIALQTMDIWQSSLHTDTVTLGHNAGELYFETNDLDAFAAKLEAHGVALVHPVTTHTWGQRVIRFYDPDRHIIEVGERMPAVARRFRDAGLTTEQIAARMGVPQQTVCTLLATPPADFTVTTPALRTPALIDALTQVWRASVERTHTFLTAREVDQIAQYVPDAMRKADLLVAAHDAHGQPIGFAVVNGDRLEMLFLHPDHIGCGLGGRLLAFACAEYGVHEVCVNEQNSTARAFYEHAGFSVCRRSPLDALGQPFPLLYLKKNED